MQDTYTNVEWLQIAQQLFQGYPRVPLSTGSQCRMARNQGEYILDRVSENGSSDDTAEEWTNRPLTIDWGEEGWDAHLNVQQAYGVAFSRR